MSASAADGTTVENTIQFDRTFERAIGVAAVERTSSGVFFELGVKSPRSVEIDLAASSLLVSNSNVSPDQKFRSINIPVVDGELITCQLKNSSGSAAPAGGIVVQFVFLLERLETR